MLFEKYDSQMARPHQSPFLVNAKLTPIVPKAMNQKDVEVVDLFQNKMSRQNSLSIRQDKTGPAVNEENRGPKITNRLPEVFLNTPRNRRSRPLAKILDLTRKDPEEQENINPNLVNQYSAEVQRERKFFRSPIRPIQLRNIKARNKVATAINTREPTPIQTPERCLVKPMSSERDNSNLRNGFQINLKTDSPPRLRIPSQPEKASGVDRSLIKPLENIASKKRTDKSFLIKKFPKFPELRNFELSCDDLNIDTSRNRQSTTTPQLNELITLRKIKTTSDNGVLKRVLHVPSFHVLDVQEESISSLGTTEISLLKDWLEAWRKNFFNNKYITKIHTCFWNAPEGCVSILLEPSKKGFLSDFMNIGGFPESCLQTVSVSVGKAIKYIHNDLRRAHGNISPNEVIISKNDKVKLSPGLFNDSNLQNSSIFRSQKSKDNILQLFDLKSQIFDPYNKFLSQDIFDFGFMLLQCAIGDFSLFDTTGLLTLKNVKNLLENNAFRDSLSKKNVCCLLHDEEFLREALKSSRNRGNEFCTGSVKGDSRNTLSSCEPNCLCLLDFLTLGNRFSKNFLNFLCGCLKLNYKQRFNIHSVLSHEFLNPNRKVHGPNISLNELLKMDARDTKLFDNKLFGGIFENNLNKFIETMRLAFLDQTVKEKFKSSLDLNNKRDSTWKKIEDAANELGVSTEKLYEELTKSF